MQPVKYWVRKMAEACVPYGLLWLRRQCNKKIDMRVKGKLPKPSAKTSPQFIVTLTSYGRRVSAKAPYAVCSLLNQSVPPDRIVLWLATGTQVPKQLQKLQAFGLEIQFCKDTRSYKKLIPALTAFPDDILITADDDCYYHVDWFKMLKEAYLKHPHKIHCHRAHEICLDENKQVIPYEEWRACVKNFEHSKRLFPTGVGGVLYPPHVFNNEILKEAVFCKLAPTNDDIWFWAMARHSGAEYALVKGGFPEVTDIGINNDGLWKINVTAGKNDEQIKNVLRAYPDVYKSIV